nr:cardiolipin synthase [Alkaliphilus hydrothermalis]
MVVTLVFGVLLLVIRFVKWTLLIKIATLLMAVVFILSLYTFYQIWRNTRLLNGYISKRSSYMNEIEQLLKNEDVTRGSFSKQEEGIISLIEANTGIPVTYHNQGEYLNGGGETIDAMIEAMDKAQHHIHVEFFIMRDDSIGNKFKDILIKKAQEGVSVRVIYDGLGSRKLKKNYVGELKKEGVDVRAYDGYIDSLLKGKLNHRNHRKIVVVDGKVGFVGGFNIGDEYLGRDENIGYWKDLQVQLEGDVVHSMQMVFLGDWYYVTDEKILEEEYFPSNHGITNYMPAQMVTSGFDTYWSEISQFYFAMITSAEDRVYIGTPYLVLNDSMLKALQVAALKGVDVRLIIPKKPDLFIVGWANESYFEKLLKSKVKIYQYDRGFLHAKVFLVDDRIVSVGTANFNTRSLFLDYEVNAVIYDKGMAGKLLEEFQLYERESQQVTYEDEMKKGLLNKVKGMLGKIIIPLA